MSETNNAAPLPDPPFSSEHPAEPQANDLEMRRRAAAVLEVLGGAKSPAEAAEALGISLPRYYQLEARALEGLISACEPRVRGRSSGEGRTLHALKKENERLRQELSRTMALARAVQRAAGMPTDGEEHGLTDGRVRKRRRPRARALRAAHALVSETPPPMPPSPQALPTEGGPRGVEPPP